MISLGEAFNKLWPSGDKKIPGLRAAMAATAPAVFLKYGITTKTAQLQFLAQISHECGAGLEIEENLSYSAERMCQVWPSRFRTISEALPYAHNPKALANKVYNGRMGNAIGSDDGWNFRGRGATQCTGREGYQKLSNKVNIDVINHPELVNSPEHFLECGAADFNLCGCLLPALAGNLYQVTLRLNGGTIGLAERQHWLNVWTAANVELPVVPPTVQPTPDVVASKSQEPVPPKKTGWLSSLMGMFWKEG